MKRTVIVVITIALLGSLNIAYPFKGDQALFAVGAKMLAGGAILYRDFWDLKQPGIYWFYHIAGAIFGYTEMGIHIAEVLWFLMLAILISTSTRRHFVLPWMSDACALLTVGVYFSVCGVWHLTQLEGLVSLPIFMCLLLLRKPDSVTRLFRFGMLVAVIALFKLMLVAIPLTFLLVFTWPRATALIRNCVIALVGVSVIIIPVVLYFSAEHQLPLMWKTFFIYPPRILREVPMNGLNVLLHGSRWFVLAAGPLLPLALIGAVSRLRKPIDRFSIAVIAWVIVATGLVLIQRMWWEYHFLLVLFPLGILATMGLEDTIVWMRARMYPSVISCLLIVVVVFPFACRSLQKTISQARHRGPQNFRLHISPDYANATVEARWLSDASRQVGSVYVLGDPLINFLTDRPQPIALNGWSPEWFLPEQWTELADELNAKLPRYIFVSAENQRLIVDRGAPFQHLLAEKYMPTNTDEIGTWFAAK